MLQVHSPLDPRWVWRQCDDRTMNAENRAALAIENTLNYPSTSDWLIADILALMERDPLDAAIDAQRLATLMAARQHSLRMK